MTNTEEYSRAEQTRARLFSAALTAFSDHGFHGTTTRDIASAAGMSPAALYVHHKSKEELLYLISKGGHEQVLDTVRTTIASAEGSGARLAAVVRALVVHHARAHTGSRVVNYELTSLSDEHLAEVLDVRRRIDAEIRHLVEQGVAEGAFDTPDPHMASVALLSLSIDISRWYRDGGSWSPEGIADFYADLALRMVGYRRG
ncbi:TetR/AcrR family transcriptional regulator [Nocardiopsis sp. CNT312]|uniref:TetR/AcrR family transcriptional regulator n=1 Tax=Nocardiopsis sp. CNT312 TaxID=1137268 RepID=UPI0004911A21|nr:TetR/AcrR family transcriptional regulator [Nocardiopsis sp. CNT312]